MAMAAADNIVMLIVFVGRRSTRAASVRERSTGSCSRADN
jgi:hypothetical protein